MTAEAVQIRKLLDATVNSQRGSHPAKAHALVLLLSCFSFCRIVLNRREILSAKDPTELT